MKFIILTVYVLLAISFANGQGKVVTFKATNYEINGENFDNIALENDVALSFYMCDSVTICFANHWRNSKSQSYGGVYAIKEKEIPETSETHRAVEMKFTWQYFNTYDSDRGEAAVTFTRIFIGNTVRFRAEILVLKTNEVLILKGYLE